MIDAAQYPLPLPHAERLSAEDFFVTDSNREAAAWIDRWPEWSSYCLILYGPFGSGKTHLKEIWSAKSHAETLALDEIESSLKRESSSKAIAIENADRSAGIASHEEALFHLFNKAKEEKISLLLTAEKAPTLWDLQLKDLRSRLVASPSVEIHAPDDALLSAMLIKQFQDRQLNIEEDVIDYILRRVDRSPATVRSLVNRLDRASLALNRRITVALAKTVLTQNEPKAENDRDENA